MRAWLDGRRAWVCVVALFLATMIGSLHAQEVTTGRKNWQDRQTLTGDWFGHRSRLEEAGFTVRSRLTQFLQGMPTGDGDNGFAYGGKVDLTVKANLEKLGFWNGLSLTAKAEYNFGRSVNGRGGTLVPVNTALLFPGIDGSDAVDLSSLYFTQTFGGGSGTLIFGKINMIDAAAGKRFAGGTGIDSFWNITFAAPPSGLVPAYLFGTLLSYETPSATYGLWVYDPIDCVNRSCLETPFSEGITIRGNVEVPVTIGGLEGHQGFAALYSNRKGTNLDNLGRGRLLPFIFNPPGDGILLPEIAASQLGTRDHRYYFAYTFDQYLYRPPTKPDEGVGVFGQFGISDGNPTRLHWSAHVGLGGTGLIPGRGKDSWGFGYFYDAWAEPLKDTLSQVATLRDEHGFEAFYNFQVAPWFTLGADLQVVVPGTEDSTATFFGLRSVIEF